MRRLTTSPRANESIFEALKCPEPPFSTLKHLGTWLLVWVQDVYGRFGVWVREQGAVWSLWWCPCRVPQGMPLSKMLMGLCSRTRKFRFQTSKSSRECDGVGKQVRCSLVLHGRWPFKGMSRVGSHCGCVGIGKAIPSGVIKHC